MAEKTGPHYFIDFSDDRTNRRIRLDDYAGDIRGISRFLHERAAEAEADKLIAKGRPEDIKLFFEEGFGVEGWLDRYFHGGDAVLMAKYLSAERRKTNSWDEEEKLLGKVLSSSAPAAPPARREIREACLQDCGRLAKFYAEIFESYPVPIGNPDYIRGSMESGTVFLYAEEGGKVISAASAEICRRGRNAEMTDCATVPAHRKEGLVRAILGTLEARLRDEGIFMAYSLSRASSFGMNRVFHQLGYRYRGRLLNNCYFDKRLENVNVWVKDLSRGREEILPPPHI